MVPLSASMASKYILFGILCFFTFFAKVNSAQHPQNVVVKGRVFCDTCGKSHLTDTNGPGIVGAVVAVECKMKRKLKPGSTSVEGKTGKNGEFRVELSPSVVHSQCGVHLVSSPQHSCNVPSIATPSHITLASNHNGVLTYNSPPLAFHPSSSSCKHSDAAESKQILLPPLLPQAPLPLPFPLLPPTPPLPNLPFSIPFPPLAFPIPFPPLAIPTLPPAPPTK